MAERTQLSRDVITDAALDVVAREGLEALSMRRLAQELDVWPMSVYRHFRDKEELLDAVAAAGTGEVELPPAKGDWRERLADLAREARGVLARQPSDLRRRAALSPAVARLTDAALGVLREAGLSRGDATVAWGVLLAYMLGSIELDAATGSERQTQAALLALSDDSHPDLGAATLEMAHVLAGGEAAFAEGVERLIRNSLI